LNIKIEEKPLHPKETEKPKEKKDVFEELKQTAAEYKTVTQKNKETAAEEKIFGKGLSEEIIKEKNQAQKILPEKKEKKEEEEILQSFVLEKPKKEVTPVPKKEKSIEFQKIDYEEQEPEINEVSDPQKRIEELSKIIPLKDGLHQKEKEENLSVAQQLGNITGFFGRGIAKTIGVKTIDKKVFDGLTKKEIKEVKKLVSSLDAQTKRYTKEEIIEAMQNEKKSSKIIETVIKILYD
jgi:hypothetical protein